MDESRDGDDADADDDDDPSDLTDMMSSMEQENELRLAVRLYIKENELAVVG